MGVSSCLRALFPSGSSAALMSASAFCATYTKAINTATTGFPTRATGGCGTATARYSSACSCQSTSTRAFSSTSTTFKTSTTSSIVSIPTSTTTPISPTVSSSTLATCPPLVNNDVVYNGGFECGGGLDGWVATDVTNTSHTLTTGDYSNTAVEFLQTGLPASGYNVPSLSQDVTGLTIGASYTLAYDIYFGGCTENYGNLSIILDHKEVFAQYTCNNGGLGAGSYAQYASRFTATANPENLKFNFFVGSQTDNAVMRLDNIYIRPFLAG